MARVTLVVDIYGTEDWVQKKDSYQRRLHLRGCLWSRDRCLVSSLGPRTVNLPFPPSLRDVFFLSKLVWNSIQMQIWRGLLSWTSAFPTRLIKQVWNGQMIRVSQPWRHVRTSGVRDPVLLQRWAKKGQSSVAIISIISSSPELLLILVGWFPNNTQRLTRIQKQNTRRRYNLMSQALMVPYFNDWLGWFYPGYSGFHPHKKIKDTKRD